MSDDYDQLENRLWRALAMIAIALAIITGITSLAQIILWLAR